MSRALLPMDGNCRAEASADGFVKPLRADLRTTVLVTGGAGYVGSVLCEHLLAAGLRVIALDRLIYGHNGPFHLCGNPRFDFEYGDARDESLMRKLMVRAEVLIPLAAIVGAPACDQDPGAAISTNLDAIRLLMSLRSRDQLVIFPTTNSGYGIRSGDAYCTEDTPLEPISLYAQTKADAEKEILSRPNTVSLRLATAFGMSPRMRIDLLVNHFVYAAVKQRYLVIFEGDFRRNYVHVRDIADCFLHCIGHTQKMAGYAFNVGLDSANLSKHALALKIKEHLPDFCIHAAPIGIDPDRRDYLVSNKRLRDAGFEARRSLDDGIRELIVGYRMMARGLFSNAG